MRRFGLRKALVVGLISISVQSISPQTSSAAVVTENCVTTLCTVSVTDPSTFYEWTVPALVSSVNFTITGGQGGQGSSGRAGGAGGRFSGKISVTAGMVISMYAGAAGAAASTTSALSGGRPSGGGGGTNSTMRGGGGGGHSQIFIDGVSAAIAGGGGGGGGWSGGVGGTGGSATFTNGVANGVNGNPGQAGGGGGGSTIGGIGGSASTGTGGGFAGSAGSSLLGGNGGDGGASGGGGGGGYFGGGGGGSDYDPAGSDGGGGGGGSNWFDSSLVNSVVGSVGNQSGSGFITITYAITGVSSFTASPVNSKTGSVSFTLTFNETVTGFTSSDLTLSGSGSSTCVMGTITGSIPVVTIPYTGCSEGRVSLTIAANSVTGIRTAPIADVTSDSYMDFTNPTISSVTVVDNTYSPSTGLNLTVNMSESVTVTGSPRIPIVIGTTTRYATYLSATNARTLTFRYVVATSVSDIDTDGIEIISPLELNGGTIVDLATNPLTSFTFTPPTSNLVRVAQLPGAPTITSLAISNGTITVNFTEGLTNGATITNYQFSTNNGSSYSAFSPVDTVTPLTITGLTNGTTYSVLIRAVVSFGTGAASNMLQATPAAITSISIALDGAATTVIKGSPITITATTGQAGIVTFYWSGKKIPGCLRRVATTTATCSWRPPVSGTWILSAMLDPTNAIFNNAFASPITVNVRNRTGNR